MLFHVEQGQASIVDKFSGERPGGGISALRWVASVGTWRNALYSRVKRYI